MAGMRYTRNRIDNVLRYKHWFFYNRWELAPFPTEFDSYRNKFSSSYFYVQVCCFFSLTLNMNMKNCTWCLRKKKYISKDVESCLSYSYIRAMYAAKKERKNFSSKCLSISEFSWCEPEPSFVPPTEVSKWPVVPVINEMSLLKFNRNANILYITIRNSDNSWVRRFSVAFENATEFLSIGRKAKRK